MHLILTFLLLSTQITASANSIGVKKIALLYNEKEVTSSTSNAVEGHAKNGLEIAQKELFKRKYDYKWINVGETSFETAIGFEETKKFSPDIIVGIGSSNQALTFLNLMQNSKMNVPIILPTATSDELLHFKNAFLMSNANSIQAKMLYREIKKVKNKKCLVVKIYDCSYCSNFADQIFKLLLNGGSKCDTLETSEARISKNSEFDKFIGYDNIILPVLELQASQVIDRLYEKNKNAFYWAGDGVGTLARYIKDKSYTKDLKIQWVCHYISNIQTSSNILFRKKYYLSKKVDPIDTSAFYYESLLLADKILYKNLKPENIQMLTGTTKVFSNQLIRPMPLLVLKNNKVQIVKMMEP